MKIIYKKARKLLFHPKKFIKDSKWLTSSTSIIEGSSSITKTTEKKIVNKKNPPDVTLYLSTTYSDSIKLVEHIRSCCDNHVLIKVGDYRLNSNEAIFETRGDIYIANITYPYENDTIIKGHLLFSIEENEFPPENDVNNKKILNKIHLINVSHMKSINDFYALYYYYKDRPECTEISMVKYALNAGIYTNKIINQSLDLLERKYLTLHQNDLSLIFRKLYRILGPDSRLELIANILVSSIRKQLFPTHFIMLLAAFLTESGEYEKALEMARKAKSKESDAWSKYRFMGLTYLLYSNNEITEEWAKNDSDLYLLLNRNEWEFEKYAQEYFGGINIIGNAPIEINLRKGGEINNGEKIVRFNGAITEYPYCLDYGSNTNVLVLNPRYYETQRNRKFGLDFIIISDGNLYSTKNLALKIHDLQQYTHKICLLPRKLDLILTQKIGASPSSGLKFLSWLYSLNGPIPRKNIYGFSLDDQDHGVATSYSNGKRVGLNTIHNWSSEKIYLDSIMK